MRIAQSLEDLLNDSEFIRWIKAGPIATEWESFKADHLLADSDLELVRSIIEQTTDVTMPSNSQEILKDTWKQIDNMTSPKLINKTIKYAVVLTLLFTLLAVGVYSYLNIDTPVTQDKEEDYWIEYTNTGNTNWPIDLSDGSQVILEPQSKIKYPRLFDQNSRRVQLTGDAFFDISRDTLKPFYVYANEAVIRVLGTSFYVKAEEEDKEIKVIVETGKVAVYKGSEVKEYQAKKREEIKPLLVTPNQIATLEKSSLKLDKRLVSRPTLTLPLAQIDKIHFESSTIAEIASALEDAYGVEIILDNNISSACRLTTTLTNQSLFEKLKIICDPLGLRYFEKDVRIHIVGNCMN